MANDPSMPPSEMNSPVPVNASPDMAAPAMEAPADGDVMISMPRVAFTAIRTLVTELAKGLDQLEQSVAEQAGQAAGAPSPAGPAEASAPAAGPGEPNADEAFLKSLAEEGSKR